MLFSRMFDLRNMRNTPMDITAAGMEAETVIPANRPKYALAPARITESKIPRMTAFRVISGRDVLELFIMSGEKID
jgi:hypothetical protein